MKLWLVRHAQSEVAAGTCYGSSDVPAAKAQTRAASHHLAQELPHGIAITCSPLMRCVQLASALGELRTDLPPRQTDARLAEMDFGDWEGHAWQAIPAADMEAWTGNFWEHRPGGGESVSDFLQRVGGAWDDMLRDPHDRVWITHAGVIRAVGLISRGQRQPIAASDWPAQGQDFGTWQVLEI